MIQGSWILADHCSCLQGVVILLAMAVRRSSSCSQPPLLYELHLHHCHCPHVTHRHGELRETRKPCLEDGDKAQCLRALTSLLEDPAFIPPPTVMVAHNYLYLHFGDLMSSSDMRTSVTHVIPRYTWSTTLTHKIQ